jgi:hypothetical protein
MMTRVVAAVLAAALVTALSASPVLAQSKKEGASKQPSAGQMAARERAKKCGAEWREAKAAGKVEKGMKWPKYWSACNKRLKAAGA